jgi:hypothetical protein
MRLSDAIEQIERAIAKNPVSERDWALNRRLVMRSVLKVLAGDEFEAGYDEGMRDAHQAARIEREHEPDDDHACPLECCRSAIEAEGENADA